MAKAGWYPDPRDPRSQLYHDGQTWTGHRRATPTLGDPIVEPPVAASPWPPPTTPAWNGPEDSPPDVLRSRPRRSRRKPIVAAVVVLVLAAAGIATWQLWPDDRPVLTYQGKQLADADATLTTAEHNLQTAVRERHGASNDDTRCYFSRAKHPGAGRRRTDVGETVFCGPVLYVDGTKGEDYLYVVTAPVADGDRTRLRPVSDVETLMPGSVDRGVELVRPDGRTPNPHDDLEVPSPPPAAPDTLVATSLDPPPSRLAHPPTLVGARVTLRLTDAGRVTRYGSGDRARAPASGYQLIAFAFSLDEGDTAQAGGPPPMVQVDNRTPQPLPETAPGDFVVASVPTSGAARLVLNDGGVTQTMTVPDGKVGSSTPAVLTRTHRRDPVDRAVSVPARISYGGRHETTTFRTSVVLGELHYWAPLVENAHASGPDRALLAVQVSITSPAFTTSVQPVPGLLHLDVPGAGTIDARDVDPSPNDVVNVFDVPATLTDATLTISGSVTISGYRITITEPASVPITFAAG